MNTYRQDLAALSVADRILWTLCRNVLVIATLVGLAGVYMAANGLAFPWAGAATQAGA